MKLLFCCFLIMSSFQIQAQQHLSDSTIPFSLKELNLTPEQKAAIKQLVWEYKLQERIRRRHLRHRIFILMNINQQNVIRRWWRGQLRK
jgi:hypothetical protein